MTLIGLTQQPSSAGCDPSVLILGNTVVLESDLQGSQLVDLAKSGTEHSLRKVLSTETLSATVPLAAHDSSRMNRTKAQLSFKLYFPPKPSFQPLLFVRSLRNLSRP